MKRRRLAYDLMLRLWPLGRALNHLANIPLLALGQRPFFRAENHEAIALPVREAVRGTESVILPLPLITPLVEQASARAILHECLCRRGEGCSTYPHQPGCLILGDGAAVLDRDGGWIASVEEALVHAGRATEQG